VSQHFDIVKPQSGNDQNKYLFIQFFTISSINR